MKKSYVELTVRLIIRHDEDSDLDDILNEMDYNFNDTTGKANVEDSTITDFVVTAIMYPQGSVV